MAGERTLHWFPSFHPQKVRLALNALDLPHEVRRVDLAAGEQRTPAFLALNPMGKAPVLVDGDLVLPESNAIVAYLGDRYGLWPKDYRARAETLYWLFFEAHYVRDPVGAIWTNRFFFPMLGRPLDEAQAARGEAELEKPLTILEARLGATPWLLGGEFTLVDCCYGPVLDAAALGGLDLGRYPAVADYLARLRALPAWQRGEFWTAANLKPREAVAA